MKIVYLLVFVLILFLLIYIVHDMLHLILNMILIFLLILVDQIPIIHQYHYHQLYAFYNLLSFVL